MSISSKTPLLRTGPGGEYQRAWYPRDIDRVCGCTLIVLCVLFPLLAIAVALVFDITDTPVKRPPASDVVTGVVDGATPAAATF